MQIQISKTCVNFEIALGLRWNLAKAIQYTINVFFRVML